MILKLLTGSFGTYILIAVAAVILSMGVTIGYQKWVMHSMEADFAKKELAFETQQRVDAQAVSAATQLVIEQERKAAANLAAARAKYQKEIANEKAKTDKLLTDYRSGAVRLRDGLNKDCSGSVPAIATSDAGGKPAGSCGLQEPDVEFLIRYSDGADALALQLNQCRAERVIEHSR